MVLKHIGPFADNICMADMTIDNNDMPDEIPADNEPEIDEASATGNEDTGDKNDSDVDYEASLAEAGSGEGEQSTDNYADLSQPHVSDRRQEECEGSDRRRHERWDFTYPVLIKIFSSKLTNASFDGYIEDISVSGAGIKFEDRYGRVRTEGLNGSGVKLIVRMPHGDDIALLCVIRWIKKDINEHTMVKIGIEFQNMEDWQLKTVKQLIGLKNKDHNMMWNLFENYEKNIR